MSKFRCSANAFGASTWTGSATDANWGTGTNWGGTAVASENTLIFTGANTSSTNTLTDNLAAGFSISGITYNSCSLAYTMSGGNSIALSGAVTNSSTSLQTINIPITMTAAQTFTMTAGGGNIFLGGNISGTGGGISATGPGTLTLTGTNSFTAAAIFAAGDCSSLHLRRSVLCLYVAIGINHLSELFGQQ